MNPRIPAAALAWFVLHAAAVYAQGPANPLTQHTGFPSGVIEGRVLDEQRLPVRGAMVSVVGRTTAAATTDSLGRYSFRELPYGPYILSVHSRGYIKSGARTVQLTAEKTSLPEIRLVRAGKAQAEAPAEVPDQAEGARTQLAAFGGAAVQAPAPHDPPSLQAPDVQDDAQTGRSEDGETAWRLRHLPRSILKDVASDPLWPAAQDDESTRWFARHAAALAPLAFFSELPLSGQLNLMTIESFDRPGEIFQAHAPRSVAYVSVNTQAAGGAWAMQGAMTQGDLASWIVAGSYKSIESANHAYELGMSYSTQQYDGGNAAALSAIREHTRNVGRVYGYDEWTISPRLVFGYGTGYARYDYLGGPGVWSPRVSVMVPFSGLRVKAMASRTGVAPGAEEFAPSVTGMWLPPERTFSSLSSDGRFAVQYTRHAQLSLERDLAAGVSVSVRGFDQRVTDQLIEIFDGVPGQASAPVGHYYVGTAGDLDARGWAVALTQEVPGILRGTVEYTSAIADWDSSSNAALIRRARTIPEAAERIHDFVTTVEATIPQSATRIYAKYRVNTAFWNDTPDAFLRSSANARFNVRVNQSLPFLRFSNADWEALVDVRNMFRELEAEASTYDEAFAIRAPKRIVGGLLVKF